MRPIIIGVCLFASFLCFGGDGISLLKEKKGSQAPIKKTVRPIKGNEEFLAKVLESNKRINDALLKRSGEPVIWDTSKTILTGRVFRGILLNSIVSTNLASPVLVRALDGEGLPYGSKFSCLGTTIHKRVHVTCSKLVTEMKEIPVTVQVLNMDGSSGLLGFYDDGKDEYIAGAIASEMAQGVIGASQSKFKTAFGEVTEGNLKNALMNGAMNGGKVVSEVLIDEMKTKEPIVVVGAGKEVLIYFMEALNENT